jgi:hypothetical protein
VKVLLPKTVSGNLLLLPLPDVPTRFAVEEEQEITFHRPDMSSTGFKTPTTAVWRSVTARSLVKSGSCKSIQCVNCEKVFSGGSQRIWEHHRKCPSCPEPLREAATEALAKLQACRNEKEAVKNMEGTFDDIATADTQSLITHAMNKNGASKEVCDKAVCDWIYINLQSFNVVADVNFKAMISTLLKFAPPGYKAPLPHLVRGKHLDEAYAKTKKQANKMFTDMEHLCALTMMSDGKTNNGKVPIVNFIAKSPHGAHFLAAVDMGTAEKDNKKMAQYLHEKCVETGFEKSFFLCVLDGALRSSFPFLIEKMPWLSCLWCSCHIISLFFKDCFSGEKGIPALKLLLEKVKKIVHFIRDRQKPLAFFGKNSDKALILPGKSIQILDSISSHSLSLLTRGY